MAVSSIPETVRNDIIKVLSQVPQRVLMKYEDEMMIDIPENIMIKKWFPQRDILCKIVKNIKYLKILKKKLGLWEVITAMLYST